MSGSDEAKHRASALCVLRAVLPTGLSRAMRVTCRLKSSQPAAREMEDGF